MSTATESDPKISEQDFLKREAEYAKRSATQALNNAKAVLAGQLDPSKLTRKHPVLSIVGALVGGFAAAAIVVPSKEDQELSRIRRLHEAMHPPTPAPPANGKNGDAKPVEKPSIGATIIHELVTLIKPILLATITAGIKSASNPPPPEPLTNGSDIPPTM